jgi:hypothetical protein
VYDNHNYNFYSEIIRVFKSTNYQEIMKAEVGQSAISPDVLIFPYFFNRPEIITLQAGKIFIEKLYEA